jgi:hypothetical protein
MPMPKATPTQPALEVAPTANPTSSDIQVEGFLPLVSSLGSNMVQHGATVISIFQSAGKT